METDAGRRVSVFCTPDASGNIGVDIVGGTLASAPAMAAVMLPVDQKYGRQGQANTVLYPLAQQKPAAFHDITLGGNWDTCIQGDSDCTLNVAGLMARAGTGRRRSCGARHAISQFAAFGLQLRRWI
jgi:hypothetical protein